MACNPRDEELKSYDSSLDVGSYISFIVEQVKTVDDINKAETVTLIASRCSDLPLASTASHEGGATSQGDTNFQLYTLFKVVTGTCDGTTSPDVIPSLGALLELDEL